MCGKASACRPTMQMLKAHVGWIILFNFWIHPMFNFGATNSTGAGSRGSMEATASANEGESPHRYPSPSSFVSLRSEGPCGCRPVMIEQQRNYNSCGLHMELHSRFQAKSNATFLKIGTSTWTDFFLVAPHSTCAACSNFVKTLLFCLFPLGALASSTPLGTLTYSRSTVCMCVCMYVCMYIYISYLCN